MSRPVWIFCSKFHAKVPKTKSLNKHNHSPAHTPHINQHTHLICTPTHTHAYIHTHAHADTNSHIQVHIQILIHALSLSLSLSLLISLFQFIKRKRLICFFPWVLKEKVFNLDHKRTFLPENNVGKESGETKFDAKSFLLVSIFPKDL